MWFLAVEGDKYNFHNTKFDTTVVHPVAALILAASIAWLLFSSRKYAVWPFIIIACFVTQLQRITLGGLDFTFLRILVVFAFVRLLMRDEIKGFKFNGLDYAVIAFSIGRIAFSLIRKSASVGYAPGQQTGALQIYGQTMDFWGMYFYFRCVVRDFDDLRHTMYGFMAAAIPVALSFIYEAVALRNLYAPFRGGDSDITRSRDGVLRCMGAYSHPILAGCFWAVLMPLLGAFIRQKGRIKIFPLVGIAAASVTIVLSGSSSPIAATGIAFVGGCLFLFRKRIRLIRWAVFLGLVTIQLVMARGAAHLLARVNIIGGSTGYYRFKLIDQFLGHWSDWWLSGSSKGTSNWDVPMYDIVNYYVNLGLSGGVVMLFLIALLFNRAFKNTGEAMKSAGGDVEGELIAWACGVSVFVHLIVFMVVTYYGQIEMTWYFSLAMTAVTAGAARPQGYGFPVMFGRQTDPLSRLAARPMGYPQQGYPRPLGVQGR